MQARLARSVHPPARSPALLRRTVPALALAMLAVQALSATAAAPVHDPRAVALGYLESRAESAIPLAPNLVEAAFANGLDPRTWPPEAPALPNVQVPGEQASAIALLRPLRAFALAGDERAWHGDLAERVAERRTPSGYGANQTLNDDAFLLLAQAARGDDAGSHGPMRQHLLAHQHASGGWGWATTAAPDADMTGIVVTALALSGGVPAGAGANASAFLATTRADDGGFAQSPGGDPNCESTVWAVRAHRLLGHPVGPQDARFLGALQRPDGGFAHLAGGEADLLCTIEVVTLLGEWRDLLPAGTAPAPTRDGPATSLAMLVAATVVGAALQRRSRLREP